MPLPPEVVLGYRSSSPIIELKLTGPESRRAEMEQAWRRVREVAGTTASLKAHAGLPATLTQRLNQQGLKLALSEQFSARLINLQLGRRGAAGEGRAAAGALHRNAGNDAGARRSLAELTGAPLALAVSAMRDERALRCIRRAAAYETVRYRASRHGLRLRQESVAMLALDMLRRWLNGGQACGKTPGWRWWKLSSDGHGAESPASGCCSRSDARRERRIAAAPAFADLHHSPECLRGAAGLRQMRRQAGGVRQRGVGAEPTRRAHEHARRRRERRCVRCATPASPS